MAVTPPGPAPCRGGLEGRDLSAPREPELTVTRSGLFPGCQLLAHGDADAQEHPWLPVAELQELPQWVHLRQSPMDVSRSPGVLGASPALPIAPAHPGGEAGSRTLLGQSTRVSRPVPAVSFSHFPSMHAAGLPSLLRSAPAILSPVSPALAMHFPSPFEISPSLRHSPGLFWGSGSRGRAVPRCC